MQLKARGTSRGKVIIGSKRKFVPSAADGQNEPFADTDHHAGPRGCSKPRMAFSGRTGQGREETADGQAVVRCGGGDVPVTTPVDV